MCRLALSSMDMEQRDYDSRTALHVAAAEGETSLLSDFSVRSIDTQTSDLSKLPECSIASYFWRLCCFQDTWRPCASSWRPAEWTQDPKTGEPTFTGTHERSVSHSSAVSLLADGATRRWTKPRTSAITTWWTSCGGVRRRAPRLLLGTPSPGRRAWARSSNGTASSFAQRRWETLSSPFRSQRSKVKESPVHPYRNTTINNDSTFYICAIIGRKSYNCVFF